jgi:hypothetical protein
MADQKTEYAILGLDFLKIIGDEALVLSTRASEMLEVADKSSVLSLVNAELVLMHMSLHSLHALCQEAIETCSLDANGAVMVPSAHFLKIADASRSGIDAYGEAGKYVSFAIH